MLMIVWYRHGRFRNGLLPPIPFVHSRATPHNLFGVLIRSAALSPIMMLGALVFPLGMNGIIDASATRNPWVP